MSLAFVTRRPVAISMLTLAVLLFGLVSLSRLPLSLLPDLSYPSATIRTIYPGAAPAEVESLISRPVEEALALVRHVRRVQSSSRAGQSDVTLEFDWGTAMDFAVLDIREKLDPLELPKESERPIVLRLNPASDPVLRYGLGLAKSQAASAEQLKVLRRIAEDSLQKPLEALPGVAAVKVSGGLEDEIQVELDLDRLARLKLDSDFVIRRLAQENVNLSGGRIDEGSLRYLVRTRNQFRDLDDMRELILLSDEGQTIRLRDVARLHTGHKERQSIIRVNGREAVEIAIFREGDGNTVAIADAVSRRLAKLQDSLPAELELTPLADQSRFIRESIAAVLQAGIFGALLAVLVLYLFLGELRSTLIIAVAIPVSVVGSFILMHGASLSLNIMSLGGLALAIGLLIDSAIVVLESIARRREAGEDRITAAQSGTRQVMSAITASTLTTVAVFFPMVFVEGVAGQLFADQALVVSGTLMIALLVALSLIPMLAARGGITTPARPARAIRAQGPRLLVGISRLRYQLVEVLPGRVLAGMLAIIQRSAGLMGSVARPLAQGCRQLIMRIEKAYVPVLQGALHRPASVIASALLLAALTLFLIPQLGSELLPPMNQGEFQAELQLPTGTPIEETDQLVAQLQDALSRKTAILAIHGVSGSGNRLDTDPESGGAHTAELSIRLPPGESEAAVMEQVRKELQSRPALQFGFSRPALFSFRTPLEIELSGYDLDALAAAAQQLEQALRSHPQFTDVKSSLSSGQPEIQIEFDQGRVAALGLQVPELAERVIQAVQGRVATRYRLGDREIDVLVRADAGQRQSVEDLAGLVINPGTATPVPLAAVASLRMTRGPSEIRRIDHQRVVLLSAELAYGELGSAVAELRQLLVQMPSLPGLTATVTGQSEEMVRSFASLRFALGLAIFLVYLVMASQFESLLQPLVILSTLPLAGIGAVLALFLTGTVVNVVVLIGLIVLAGIVVNNGIVLIDRINQLQDQIREQAILQAARERLRPIVMTSLTTILGLLPLALARGQGAELRAPLAITVIGGLSIATALTLILIPVLCSLLPDRQSAANEHASEAEAHRGPD